ncbi:MAG: TetR/AcrR family transcriptional regulator [Caulobacteraceae bacterium]|nr:TetR/AcrR family transcriptional regulator [Caulobacter sp.]
MPPLSSTARVCSAASISPVPRGERRRREIAAVAEQVFFENGFTDTTMQTIAARAGASKETLYRHFGSKEGLFAEIVETRARTFLGGLDGSEDWPGSVGEVLRETGLLIMEGLFGQSAISLCRIVVAESPRSPELGRIFLEEGPYRIRRHLTVFLDAARRRGELSCEDPGRAATIFLGALIAAVHIERLVLQPPPVLTREQAVPHVDEAVAMFLARYAKS